MAMNSSGQISLAGTTAGESIEIENGGNGTTQISLNDTAVRTLAQVPSGQISMPSDFWGKANTLSLTITSNQVNLNLRTYALANGWDASQNLLVTLNTGIGITSASNATPALTIDGSFPNGVSFVNNGLVQGAGGEGGYGGLWGSNGGYNGGNGGTAIQVSVPVTITNNATLAGGGGGGGGGGVSYYTYGSGKSAGSAYSTGGGGGGGAGINAGPGGNSGGGSGGYGNPGTATAGGAGAAGAAGLTPGGTGGSLGQAGYAGTGGNRYGGGGGGAAGYYVNGNSNVTWLATGTLIGNVA